MGLFSMFGDEYEVDPKSAAIPGYDAWQAQLRGGAQRADGREAASMGASQLDNAQAAWRDRQTQLADQLTAQAAGHGPSLAQAQLRQATDRSMAQSMALLNSARGNPAGSLRQAAYLQGAANAQAGADASTLRLQEQMQAQNMLGQLSAGARGQDIAFAGENARLQQDAAHANLQATMQQRQMNDALVQYYVGAGLSLAEAQQRANAELQRTKLGAHEGSAGRGIGVARGLAQGAASGIGAGINAIIPGL